jgi:hypothetical protein
MREPKKPFCEVPRCKYHDERYFCTQRRRYWSFKNYKRGHGFVRVYRTRYDGHFFCENCIGIIHSYRELITGRRIKLRGEHVKKINYVGPEL